MDAILKFKVIDSIVHITGNGTWFDTGLDAGLPRLRREMERAGVDRAVLVANPSLDDNHLMLDTAENNQDIFIPFAAVSPAGKSEEMIEKEMARFVEAGFAGIKIHPRLCGLSLASREIDTCLRLAGKYDLTAYLCTIHRPPSPPLHRPVYDIIHELCCNNTSTRIVLIHGGYTELLQTSEVIRSFENVLLDLSQTLTRFADSSIGRDIAWLFETFEKRLVVGSDFPEYTYSDVLAALDRLGISRDHPGLSGAMGRNLSSFLTRS